MRYRETAIEQEIRDHGLDGVLGLGRGVLRAGDLLNDMSEQDKGKHNEVFAFIEADTEKEMDGAELADALASESSKTADILSALRLCSIHGAVNAIANAGSTRQKEYLARVLERYDSLIAKSASYEDHDDDYTSDDDRHSGEPHNVKLGLWQDVVFASMIGTPEMGALSLARRWTLADSEKEDTRRSTYNLPAIRGYRSYIFPPDEEARWEYRDGERVTSNPDRRAGTVGYAFPELAKTYEQVKAAIERKNPDDTAEAIEHAAVCELARIIAKSTEYNSSYRSEGSPYRAHFAEQMAWARLGDQVQRQFRGMRQKIRGIDLHNIGRFIGKAGDNPYDVEWRRIEKLADTVTLDHVGPAREYLLEKTRDDIQRQHRRYGNDAAHKIITEGAAKLASIDSLTNDEVLARFQAEREKLAQKRNEHMSLAQKALDLHFKDGVDGDATPIDWINTAPFGLINRTHKALNRGVSKDTAFAYAVAEYSFPGEATTRELVEACHGFTKENLDKMRALHTYSKETGLAIDLIDEVRLGKVAVAYDSSDVIDLMGQGYSAREIIENGWLCHLDTRKTIDFPARGNDAQKQRWCTENGYAYLNGGWIKTSIGKIILSRLESGLERSIHDASQWLETFQIPEEGYDIPALKARIQNDEQIQLDDIEKTTFYDVDLESNLLAGILKAPQDLRDRLLLPRKTQKIQQIFFAPEHQLLYLALADVYRDSDIDINTVRDHAFDRLDEFYDEWLTNARGKETTHRISKDDLREKLLAAIENVNNSVLSDDENITGVIQRLSKYGNNRKRYIDDATSWLLRHATSPSARLTKVWGDRAVALIEGANDSARDIEIWQSDNALRLQLREMTRQGSMPHNLTAAEVMGEFGGWVWELSRCYDSDRIIRAISEYKSVRTTEALLPPQVMEMQTSSGVYKAEVLAKDDPRGMTIGVDTGCCMTLGGASASCIESGYKHKNAGFFALYTPQGRLAAQSYFYVNPNHSNVLVLDNIEANQGRNTDKILELYEEALTQYLLDRFAADSEWNIDTVHVGTGYGDVVKASVLRLPAANTISNNLGRIYTDADQQRLLLRLSNEQIAESRQSRSLARSKVENIPNHLPEIVTRSLSPNDSEIIRELEEQIYPGHMRQYGDREMLQEELDMNGMGIFSFLVAGQADSSKDYIGYCMAYLEQSETEPNRSEPIVYAADMAILPESQGFHIGATMFDELLRRTSERGVDKIEMHARETTSYAALKHSEWAKHILYHRGYKFVDYGAVDEFDDGNGTVEKLYLVGIEKLSR